MPTIVETARANATTFLALSATVAYKMSLHDLLHDYWSGKSSLPANKDRFSIEDHISSSATPNAHWIKGVV
jgi:hypothetical protein